jgi:ABC-type branched-subunit amino acid transport system ATPase component
MLAIEGLTKRFGGIVASDGITLALPQGELHAIIGPNGAGKTTLITQLAGELAPDAGSIRFAGSDITAVPAWRRSQLGLARSFQITSLFLDFTALDNVALAASFGAAQCAPAEARAEARRWLEFTGLGRRATALPHELNLHERKFLELARALAGRPRVILLDEVLSGLNPTESGGAVNLLRGIRDAVYP